MTRRQNTFRYISLIGTCGLLLLVALKSGVMGPLLTEIGTFLMGGALEIAQNDSTFLIMCFSLMGIVFINVALSLTVTMTTNGLLGKRSGAHSLDFMKKPMEKGRYFYSFFICVLIEELFARWIFLGLLTKISFLSGPIGFYALLLIGNGLWALVHIYNFENEDDRNLLRVLPQFIGGILLSFVFVKYGLMATVLTHFASNAVIFSTAKMQEVNWVDGAIVFYSALLMGISFTLMNQPISDVLIWLTDNPTFAIEGWEFWDYVKVSVFLTSAIQLIFGATLYDRGEAGDTSMLNKNTFLALPIGAVIVILLVYSSYSFLGMFMSNIPIKILVITILLTSLKKDVSGSSISRTFLTGLPTNYILICIISAVGFWAALGYMLVEVGLSYPNYYLISLDD